MQKFSKWLIKEAISATAVDSVNKIVKSFLAKKLGTKVYKNGANLKCLKRLEINHDRSQQH